MANYAELTIEQGATFTSTVTVYDGENNLYDLSGYTPFAQIRKSYFTTAYSNINVAVADASNGLIALSLPAANTASLVPGRYVYDLVIQNAEVRFRVVEGIATVYPSVTR